MFPLFKCFHGQHWPWDTSWVRLCLLSLTGLTLWLLFNRYLPLCMLRSNDDLLIADRKFCIKFWKPTMEMPNKAFSNKVTRRTLTFERFSWFKYGESLVKDCECSCITSTDYTVQYVMKIHKSSMQAATLWKAADRLGLSYGTCQLTVWKTCNMSQISMTCLQVLCSVTSFGPMKA